MSSPAKRRKLDGGDKKTSVPSRGLEYFFARQRQGETSGTSQTASEDATPDQTDEELARKLQAEFDKEALRSPPNASETPRQPSSTPAAQSDDKPDPSAPGQADGLKSPPKKEGTTLRLQSSGSAEDTVSSSIPLDESPLTFDPSDYIPKLQESWSGQSGNATYALLVRCFTVVNSTQSRIKIVDTLVNCIRLLVEGDPESLLPAVRIPPPGSPPDLT